MQKTITKISSVVLVTNLLFIGGCKGPVKKESIQSRFPQNVLQSCTVSSSDFNSWFASGTATENGLVLPANSIAFPHNNNCDFYKWSQQMFLWITSPTSSGMYANGNTVMESSLFYTVSPANAGKRTLIPHTNGVPISAMGHISQTGPNKLPVIIDKKGRMFEVVSSQGNEKIKILNAAGKETEVHKIETNPDGLFIFKDKAGNPIKQPKALIKNKINPLRIVQEFRSEGKSLFLDATGAIVEIDSEEGQAGSSGALMAQNGSLVYYITMVNDVYAYFVTGVNEKKLLGNQFPTDSMERDSISAFARSMGAVLPDSNALAIELKTSWVEAVNLKDLASYITIDAIIPDYDTTNPDKWIPTGQRKAKLALIGMHIVGSVAKHPEMIWATFEHINNAPNAPYSYIDSTNQIINMPQDTGSSWLLSTNAADTSANTQKMKVSGDTINGYSGYPVSSSNTLRIMAFGSSSVTPNAEDANAAASNSEIISINNAVLNMLVGNDIRKNYFLIGATWTFGGTAPNGQSYAYPSPVDTVNGVAIGTSQLANSTMETYVQSSVINSEAVYAEYGSCLSCHSNNNSLKPEDLSHVFGEIQSLPGAGKNK